MIRGVKCPACDQESITYNGNYYCTQCDWALPAERRSQKDSAWLEVAYVRYMEQSGREPQAHHIEAIREGY